MNPFKLGEQVRLYEWLGDTRTGTVIGLTKNYVWVQLHEGEFCEQPTTVHVGNVKKLGFVDTYSQ